LKYEHLSLEPLLIRLLPDDIEIHHNTLMVGKIDYICSFLSLPFILGQKSFKDVPPLMDLNEIEPRHLPSEKFKIGLAYFGDRTHPHDHFRSMPIKNFEILQQVEGVELYDLTIDHKPRMTIGKGQVKLYEGLNVIRKEISDWEDTASLIEAMDLIVCVDTGVCHLAGVMKKKAFLLLPYSPDWRWGLEDKNWWYKDMPIFRQSKFNDWSEALQRLNFVVLEEVKKIFIERINKYYDDR